MIHNKRVNENQYCYVIYKNNLCIAQKYSQRGYVVLEYGETCSFDELMILEIFTIPKRIKELSEKYIKKVPKRITCPDCKGFPQIFPDIPSLYYVVCQTCGGKKYIEIEGE